MAQAARELVRKGKVGVDEGTLLKWLEEKTESTS
jgi:hypothetical protein